MIDRAKAIWSDSVTRARILRWLWIVSSAFTLAGFAIIAYLLLFGR